MPLTRIISWLREHWAAVILQPMWEEASQHFILPCASSGACCRDKPTSAWLRTLPAGWPLSWAAGPAVPAPSPALPGAGVGAAGGAISSPPCLRGGRAKLALWVWSHQTLMALSCSRCKITLLKYPCGSS